MAAAAREILHILWIEHRLRHHLIVILAERQRLDLTDIDAQIANRHAFRQLAGVIGMQRNLAADRARRRLGRIKRALAAFGVRRAAHIVEADGAAQRAVQRRRLNGQAAAVKLHARAAFRPEHALAGQQLAVLRLDVHGDIEGAGARRNVDDFAHFIFAVKHHRTGLHVRQAVGGQRQRRRRAIADNAFLRLFGVGKQRIGGFHLALLAGLQTDAAVDPFARAGAQHLHAVEAELHVESAVDDKLAVAVHQVAIGRLNRRHELNAFLIQLARNYLADLHAVQHDRLTGVDAVTLRRAELHRQHVGLLQQRLVGGQHGKVALRLAVARHQLQRIAGQQAAEVGIGKTDFRTAHLNARAAAHQADHGRVEGQLARDFAAAQQVEFSQAADLQPLIDQRRAARFQVVAVGQIERDHHASLAARQIGIEFVVLVSFRLRRIFRRVKGDSAVDQRRQALQLHLRAAQADVGAQP